MALPGGELSNRPLHFFWIVDCSGSMSGEKIESLNNAIKEALPAMRAEADKNPNAQVYVRTIKFSNGAEWIDPQPEKLEDFRWFDLSADGVTDMGRALSMVADELKGPLMKQRALPPVLVLISDGQPTDDFNGGLNKLVNTPWGGKAVRIAIAVGTDADKDVLQKFIGRHASEFKVLEANNPQALVKYIKWVSTAVLSAASQPLLKGSEEGEKKSGGSIPIPVPPKPDDDTVGTVW